MVSHKYYKNFLRNSHWRNLSMIMWWERYSNASPKPDFFLFSLFIFSFISQLIWIRLGWNFHRWFSIQERVNWCTIDPFSLYFCTSQHSYPVPLGLNVACFVSRPFFFLQKRATAFKRNQILSQSMIMLNVMFNLASYNNFAHNMSL